MGIITDSEKDGLTNPPGTLLKEITVVVSEIGSINFGETFKQPLPTLNQAIMTGNGLEITAVVLVRTTLRAIDLKPKINQQFTIGSYGENQLQFFIYCDEEQLTAIIDSNKIADGGTVDNTYQVFKVEFTTTDETGFPTGPEEIEDEDIFTGIDVKLKDIKQVQTFLWNIDPVTSRGTVTTVQSASISAS
nr:hypothetical protein [uncultured Flavobacterium sp.]